MVKFLQFLIILFLIFTIGGCNSIINTNQPPEITSMPITIANIGEQYTYQVIATDPDNDELSYSLLAFPSGMQINSSTGLVQWTPNQNQIKAYIVEIAVSDVNLSATQNYSLIVSE